MAASRELSIRSSRASSGVEKLRFQDRQMPMPSTRVVFTGNWKGIASAGLPVERMLLLLPCCSARAAGGNGNDEDDVGDEEVTAEGFEFEPVITPPPSSSSSWSTGQLLLLDAIFYHLQSVSAYCTMGCMSPVSQSVANTLKRALLVWASILYFGNPVTSSGVLGMVLVVLGVFLYNHMRRLYQS
mmetsp:Transcript_26374/g.55340  ORF Transcript_26374/g.55340 Transcript_26374/m.55340 type:complete len:185 (+) Transcript_26374:836-1390(+)